MINEKGTAGKSKFQEKVVQHFSRQKNNRLNALGVLSMEQSLINEKVTAGNSNFQEKVVQHFIRQKNRKMIFFYKGKSTLF